MTKNTKKQILNRQETHDTCRMKYFIDEIQNCICFLFLTFDFQFKRLKRVLDAKGKKLHTCEIQRYMSEPLGSTVGPSFNFLYF